MKKLIIALTVIFAFAACKGPKSGPLVKESFTSESKPTMNAQASPGGQAKQEKANIKIEPCEGCLTISKLFTDKKTLSGKTVKIKGQVTKFLPQIMGKNWIHMQDGTEFEGGYDLTVTTDIMVNVGDLITIEGKVAVDKDFGYGYFYNVLLEEGKISK
jgi:hypothetical protein